MVGEKKRNRPFPKSLAGLFPFRLYAIPTSHIVIARVARCSVVRYRPLLFAVGWDV